jgi:guanine nucleotide-binding protein subunit alpha
MVHVSAILFLNKTDIFVEKLPLSPLAKYFPAYKGWMKIINAKREIIVNIFNSNSYKNKGHIKINK